MHNFSWGKFTLAVFLLVFLAFIFAAAILAGHSRIDPGPKLRLGEQAPLPGVAPDFRAIEDIPARKQAFFGFFEPLIERQNAYYLQERQRLQQLLHRVESGRKLSWGDRRKLAYWSGELNLAEDLPLEERLELLELRLHRLPPAMVLAQAAAESAWGQSRFAREASNYFGQWCYSAGCGLVPLQRNANAKHEVRRFDSAQEAVESYFRNINTHRAYRPLREKRLELEKAGEEVSASDLVGELGRYSERGQHYIDELRLIIRGNQLE